jgi:hypothetical protein
VNLNQERVTSGSGDPVTCDETGAEELQRSGHDPKVPRSEAVTSSGVREPDGRRRRRIVMKVRSIQLLVVVLSGLAVGACSRTVTVEARGADSTSSTVTDVVLGFDPSPPVETWGPPEGEPVIDSVVEFCTGSGDARIEMAFSGTIRSVDDSAGRPWMVFEVAAWFTDDLGAYMGLWAPDFAGTVDERWLVSASRFSVGNRAAGDLYWCASELYSSDSAESWGDEYGGSVVPGSAGGEGEADLEVLAQVEAARQRWDSQKPSSYTYIVNSDSRTADYQACGSGQVAVTVDSGEIIQARDLRRHCDVPSGQILTVADAFDLARDSAGAIDYAVSFDSEFGFIESFYAVDRSIETSANISNFQVGAYPLATDIRNDLQAALSKWESTGITAYSMRLDVVCFCGHETPIDVTVIDGVREDPPGASAADTVAVSVNELFDVIAENLNAEGLEVSFDPQLGHPTSVRIDPNFNTSDDEISYFILSLTDDAD